MLQATNIGLRRAMPIGRMGTLGFHTAGSSLIHQCISSTLFQCEHLAVILLLHSLASLLAACRRHAACRNTTTCSAKLSCTSLYLAARVLTPSACSKAQCWHCRLSSACSRSCNDWLVNNMRCRLHKQAHGLVGSPCQGSHCQGITNSLQGETHPGLRGKSVAAGLQQGPFGCQHVGAAL